MTSGYWNHAIGDIDGAVRNKNYVWDTNSLSWVAATGSLVDGQNVSINNWPVTGSGNLKVAIQEDNVGISGGGSSPKAVRTDQASATILYVGKAAAGSSAGSAAWSIQRIDTSSGTVITWADGNTNEDNVWNNRASLSYS